MAKSRLGPKKVSNLQRVPLSKTSTRSLCQATLFALLLVTLFGVFLSNEQLRKINIEIEVKSSLLRAQRTRLNISSSSTGRRVTKEIEIKSSLLHTQITRPNISSLAIERRGPKEIDVKIPLLRTQKTRPNTSSSPIERRGPKESSIHRKGTNLHCSANGILSNLDPYVHLPQPRTYNRGECSCTPVKFFVLLSMQRSGSGWFETLLNSHPNISSNGEIFYVAERRANTSSVITTLDKVYNLDWSTTAAKSQCTAAVGFKWQLNQGVMDHSEAILKYLRRKRVLVILLFRRNLLRRLISALANDYDKMAKKLNGVHKSHAHSKKEAEALAHFKPTIDTTTLKSNLSIAEQAMKDCYERFKITNHKILFYEDMLRNNKTLSDVQKFLGVPVKRLKSQQVKIHTRPTSKLIENWKDVYRILNGTKYKNFLHKTDYDR